MKTWSWHGFLCLELFQSQTAARQILLAGDSDASQAACVPLMFGALLGCWLNVLPCQCVQSAVVGSCGLSVILLRLPSWLSEQQWVTQEGRLWTEMLLNTPAAFWYRMWNSVATCVCSGWAAFGFRQELCDKSMIIWFSDRLYLRSLSRGELDSSTECHEKEVVLGIRGSWMVWIFTFFPLCDYWHATVFP